MHLQPGYIKRDRLCVNDKLHSIITVVASKVVCMSEANTIDQFPMYPGDDLGVFIFIS